MNIRTPMNNQYFENMEDMNDKNLAFFNERTHFFVIPNKDQRETPKYSIIDRQLKDKRQRTVNIELKTRLCDINTFDNIFIEEKKWEKLKEDYTDHNIIPLYINFFQTPNNVLIFDLRQWFDNNIQPESTTVDINNYGYERTDRKQKRFLLPQRKGILYKYIEEYDTYIRQW